MAVPLAVRPDATLNPLPSGTPSLSNASSPTFGGEACILAGIATNTVVGPRNEYGIGADGAVTRDIVSVSSTVGTTRLTPWSRSRRHRRRRRYWCR